MDWLRFIDFAPTAGAIPGVEKENSEPFEVKTQSLTAKLGEQFRESGRLDAGIRANQKRLSSWNLNNVREFYEAYPDAAIMQQLAA